MLGVSTTPVKDAIRKLESEGLVRTEARRGVFVEFSPRQALEMALGRAALESVMAHIAANHLTEDGAALDGGPAPYLDCRPLTAAEKEEVRGVLKQLGL